jgi:hypothetical protein
MAQLLELAPDAVASLLLDALASPLAEEEELV